jgi:uncharacterized protein YlxW (UPF0749 family)
MVALLVAVSLVAHAAQAHKHEHKHKHKPPPVHVNRCRSDAKRVQELEERIGRSENPESELERLEDQLERAMERAREDCGA